MFDNIINTFKKWTITQYAILLLIAFGGSMIVTGIADIGCVGTGESGDLMIEGYSDVGDYYLLAANNATDAEKAVADGQCDGTDDQVQWATADTDAAGGVVVVSTGSFSFSSSFTASISTFKGQGAATWIGASLEIPVYATVIQLNTAAGVVLETYGRLHDISIYAPGTRTSVPALKVGKQDECRRHSVSVWDNISVVGSNIANGGTLVQIIADASGDHACIEDSSFGPIDISFGTVGLDMYASGSPSLAFINGNSVDQIFIRECVDNMVMRIGNKGEITYNMFSNASMKAAYQNYDGTGITCIGTSGAAQNIRGNMFVPLHFWDFDIYGAGQKIDESGYDGTTHNVYDVPVYQNDVLADEWNGATYVVHNDPMFGDFTNLVDAFTALGQSPTDATPSMRYTLVVSGSINHTAPVVVDPFADVIGHNGYVNVNYSGETTAFTFSGTDTWDSTWSNLTIRRVGVSGTDSRVIDISKGSGLTFDNVNIENNVTAGTNSHAVFIAGGATPLFRNTYIRSAPVYGSVGVLISGGSPTFKDCEIEGGDGVGGNNAVSIGGTGSPMFVSTMFSSGSVAGAAAISLWGTTEPDFYDCYFAPEQSLGATVRNGFSIGATTDPEIFGGNYKVNASSNAIACASDETNLKVYGANIDGVLSNIETFDVIAGGQNYYVYDPALTEDHSYSGDVEWGTAGEVLAWGDLCYKAGDWYLADINAGTVPAVSRLAYATATVASGSDSVFLTEGFIRDDSRFTFSSGSPVYISNTAGNTIDTASGTSAFWVRHVGWQDDNSGTILLDPSWIPLKNL